jgi:hypothetical protein
MTIRRLTSALLLLAAMTSTTHAQQQPPRGPSTAEERATALHDIADLKEHPLGPDARAERRWLTAWIAAVPDVQVSMCTSFFPTLPKNNQQDSTILTLQMVYSSTGYVIEHMQGKLDVNAEYLAGVEGALAAYEHLVEAKPEDREPDLDALIKRRDAGTLPAYIKATAQAGCTG